MEEEISIRMTRSSPNIPWGVGFSQNGNEVVVDFLDKGSIAEKAGLHKTDRLVEFQHSSMRAPDAYAISRDLERLLEVSMKLKRTVGFPTGIPWSLDNDGKYIGYQTFNDGHKAFHSTDKFNIHGGYNTGSQGYNSTFNNDYTNRTNSNSMYSSPSLSQNNFNRETSIGSGKYNNYDYRSSASSPYSGPREPYQYNPRNYNNVSVDARLSSLHGGYPSPETNDYGHIIHHSVPQSDCFKRISKAVGTPCY
uniref:PDZ domain-containing protein n=1 Tax=Parastrongyloides trichosuri TaxID=131310 RepID=A0A0N4ZC32_PARTI